MIRKIPYKKLFSFSKHEISDFFKHAPRVFRSPDLDLLCKPAVSSYGRFIPLTPKRIGSAPERNKIRRQLKAIFYEHNLSSLGIDCIAVVKKEILTHPFDQLEELLCSSLQKAQNRLHTKKKSHATN